MYRAGWIVNAEECDYESSRNLGLVCPFCSEALFWAGDYSRVVKEQTQFVSAAFRHYRSADPTAQDCELRATRPDGEAFVNKLEIQSRNQRLELYNRRLWEIFCKTHNQAALDLKRCRKLFGTRWLDNQAKLARNYFRDHSDALSKDLAATFEAMKENKRSDGWQCLLDAGEIDASDEEEYAATVRGFDSKIHIAVAQEVAAFLGTRTAGYVFAKLFAVGVYTVARNVTMLNFETAHPDESLIRVFAPQIKQTDASYLISGLTTLMLLCDWVSALKEIEVQSNGN